MQSISTEVHEQLKELKKQNQIAGGILTATPNQIQSNIKSLQNEGELVLGYFGVSGVTQKKELVFR
ncbi:hypothetical protein [Xanthovirga aplysinae]|uniref:hypothetical protein n=1 Tax=Xanthovirga aplysinae TaxID=2529853 RepID=UPI0012BCB87B|nr:hypothetical protein [Xanthovirga aplysinae]MTI32598.1 hypothetical protein [Xanthovirga aplysinae]